jgi:hypothetical protein
MRYEFWSSSALENSNRAYGETDDYKLQNRLVLAMAHQRLGHPQQARAFLDRVHRSWDRVQSSKRDGAVTLFSVDWLPLQLFRREADAMILYDPIFPADPFAH